MAALATIEQAAEYGYVVTQVALNRASQRVKTFVKQDIELKTHTAYTSAYRVVLPKRPVRSLVSVKDIEGNPYTNFAFDRQTRTLALPSLRQEVTITYTAGWEEIPDSIVEIVSAIAARIVDLDANDSLRAGVAQETGGNESVSYGSQAFNALISLTDEEKKVLRRLFPKVPRSIITA
jgi:hypothetical protein